VTSETHPGGAGALESPPAFFNVAFRTDEPIGGPDQYWSNSRQARALAVHDMAPFTVPIDADALRRRSDVDVVLPTTGSIDRIMSSHFDLGAGVDLGNSCGIGTVRGCTGQMLTRLQPYNLYVPPLAEGAPAYGLTVHLHSLNANHNQYANTKNQRQYAERGQGTLVMTPLARGADSQYYDHGLADVFEAWADVAAHYPLEPAFTSIAGYSMGGYGTFKLAMAYPDLFARGHATVGSAYPHEMRLPSLRNVPMLMWNATADYLVPVAEPVLDWEEALRYGIRLELDLFHTAEHLLLAVNDEYGPGAAFLGEHRVVENPPLITYVVNPIDLAEHGPLGLNADHAYWLSGMRVRTPGDDTGGRDTFSDGRADAHSHAFGVGESTRRAPETGAGVLEGGVVPALPYTRHILEWDDAPDIQSADRLDLTLVNLATVTVDMARARLTCDAEVDVDTDGPVDVTFAGCGRTVRYG
jgi:pimeloyl-ACP methyl ester carboxylesterase